MFKKNFVKLLSLALLFLLIGINSLASEEKVKAETQMTIKGFDGEKLDLSDVIYFSKHLFNNETIYSARIIKDQWTWRNISCIKKGNKLPKCSLMRLVPKRRSTQELIPKIIHTGSHEGLLKVLREKPEYMGLPSSVFKTLEILYAKQEQRRAAVD
jgi:hypothetical protein